jgi:uncharacterized protein DUF4139/uncharacterized protein DUF4140
MKNLIVIIALCTTFLFAEKNINVESKVIDVTVFKDRALVTREAKKKLSKGDHILVFSGMTQDLQDESVRISAKGTGIVKILDVKVERKFVTENQTENIEELEAKIENLKQQLQVSFDQISVYNSKKEFVESLQAEALKVVNAKILSTSPSINKWSEMLKFVDRNLNEIFNGLRDEDTKKKQIEKEIKEIQREINQSKTWKTDEFKEIIVKIENDKAGNVNLQPTYLVQNASWYPVYDARLLSQSKTIEMNYFGMIQQSTGEDWENISLTLSTAEPMTAKFLPELSPWYINNSPLPRKGEKTSVSGSSGNNYRISYDQNYGIPSGKGTITGYVKDRQTGEPLPGVNVVLDGTTRGAATDGNGKFLIPNIKASRYNLVFNYIGFRTLKIKLNIIEKHNANLIAQLDESALEVGEAIEVTAERSLISRDMATNSVRLSAGVVNPTKPSYTNVFAKELSTNFRVKAKSTIPSDNSSHKVIVSIDELPIEFKYTAIPKISPKVYLNGKILNNTDFPFLEGEVNVFVDDDFLNKTFLNTMVPSDTLELALGSDEKIQIEKKLIKKYQESAGLLGGSKKITYEYEIQITNNRKSEEMITMQDQLPISMNEDIQLEIILPKKEKDEMKNDFRLEWKINLKPGEKKIIPIKFSIEHPNNLRVYGLE